ncbi:6681_t:CDS:2 [Gigaspora rosea]|nr:6681_t:CDS:2 [Gigaspora rosea]
MTFNKVDRDSVNNLKRRQLFEALDDVTYLWEIVEFMQNIGVK